MLDYQKEYLWENWSMDKLAAEKTLMDKGPEFTNVCSIEISQYLPNGEVQVFVTRRYWTRTREPLNQEVYR
jgi:hypothetical protein